MVQEISRKTELAVSPVELCQIVKAVRQTQNIPGEIAELGTYAGSSAYAIAKTSKGKEIHLFDTFEGLPEAEDKFKVGDYAATVEFVQSLVPRAILHKGVFPATAHEVEDKRFSFVHLDADLYSSTRAGLEFFYPRLNPGGMLISHDYALPGVRRAFDEYFGYQVKKLFGTQCLVRKETTKRGLKSKNTAGI